MKEYVVVVGGIEHTIQATDEDAKARGLVEVKKATPKNKARTPANKAK